MHSHRVVVCYSGNKLKAAATKVATLIRQADEKSNEPAVHSTLVRQAFRAAVRVRALPVLLLHDTSSCSPRALCPAAESAGAEHHLQRVLCAGQSASGYTAAHVPRYLCGAVLASSRPVPSAEQARAAPVVRPARCWLHASSYSSYYYRYLIVRGARTV